MRYHQKAYKSILSPQNGMNLYRGCTHGCIYCDSRSRCYQMLHDFEDIEVKTDAPVLLEAELRRKRRPCMIATGAMSDPYLPLEAELQLTRRCLEIIGRYGFGLSVLTKSNLILRDLELLAAIHRKTKCVVQMTLTTYDESLCRVLEPGVCTTKARFDVLRAMRDHGIPTVVWLCPLLRFLNDTEENLRGILDYCVRAGVWGILTFGIGLTLREGNREYFYAALDRHFPGLKAAYRQTFGERYQVTSSHSRELMRIFRDECRKHGIVCDPDEIFRFLHTFPEEAEQLTFF